MINGARVERKDRASFIAILLCMIDDQIRPADLTRHHEDRLLKGERRQRCSRRSGAQADLPRLLRGRLDGADEPHMNVANNEGLEPACSGHPASSTTGMHSYRQ